MHKHKAPGIVYPTEHNIPFINGQSTVKATVNIVIHDSI